MWRFGVILLGIALVGCDMPRDVDGAFALIRGGKIRVGVSENPPWTTREASRVSGVEVTLLKQLAEQLDAKLQWHYGAESELFEKLHHGRLDVVIGGITDDSPWSDYVGLTRPYVETPAETTGHMKKHVWAVRGGENRWLLEVDRFLQSHRAEIVRLLTEPRR